MLSFGAEESAGGKEDEWVQTHAGRCELRLDQTRLRVLILPSASLEANNDKSEAHQIDDIPDDDAHGAPDNLHKDMGNMSLGGTGVADSGYPDIDDIPDIDDMEEAGLEEPDDAAAAAPVRSAATKNSG